MVDIVNYTPVPLKTLMANIDAVKFNPSLIQLAVLTHLNDVTNGLVDIVDPTNPFIFLLESAAVCSAAAINQNDINTRKLYPTLAQTQEDLYLHMSDLDYVNRFATPSTALFTMMFDENTLLNSLVDAPAESCTKLIIPRNTFCRAGGIVFSLQYPIVIKHLYSGVVVVEWDSTINSPFYNLTYKTIDHLIVRDNNGVGWLKIDVPMTQFNVSSTHYPISVSSAFVQSVSFTDLFYYARVYFKPTTGSNWVEMFTTHSDQIYNYTVPTAILKVINKTVQVVIPPVYLNNGLVSGSVRVDVYETLGQLNINLSNLNMNSFETVFQGLDDVLDVDVYNTNINKVTVQSYSGNIVNGGRNELPFDTLRTNVINNSSGALVIPITNNQLIATASTLGFTLVPNVDSVTNRIFTAHKPLPAPTDNNLITPCSLSVDTATLTMNGLNAHGASVKANGLRVTITPKALFTNINGVIKLVPDNEILAVSKLPVTTKVSHINNEHYIYTPFYYVLDNTGSSFVSRAYNLDIPTTANLNFIDYNSSTELQVNTAGYGLSKTDTGYKLTIITKSDALYKATADANVALTLAFTPYNESSMAFIKGVIRPGTGLNGRDRVFDFDIVTNLDIDSNDNILLNNVIMLKRNNLTLPVPLSLECNLIYSTDSVTLHHVPSYVDGIIRDAVLPPNSVSITMESIQLNFGVALKNLWSNSNSSPNATSYQYHPADVPMLYEKDTYQAIDPNIGNVFSIVNNTIVYPTFHKRGDPVLDAAGLPIMRYKAGDLILSPNGTPLMSPTADVVRYVDLLFIEGVYYWANDLVHLAYQKEVTSLLTSWINSDLGSLTPRLLEKTKLFYYARRDVGQISVLSHDNLNVTIEAKQALTVDYYVRNVVFNDLVTRKQMELKTVVLLDKLIKARTVANIDLSSGLKNLFGVDVVSVKVSGLGGNSALETLTVINDSDGLSLNKIIVALEDGTLITKEDVTINFYDHEHKVI